MWAPASMKNPPEQRIFRNLRRKVTFLHIVASHLNPPEQRIFRNLRRKATFLHIVTSHLFATVPDKNKLMGVMVYLTCENKQQSVS